MYDAYITDKLSASSANIQPNAGGAMQRYHASNKISPQSILTLLVVSIVVGLLVGGVVAFISRFLYLVVLFPIIMGAVGGAVIDRICYAQKVRSPLFAAFFGILVALTIY